MNGIDIQLAGMRTRFQGGDGIEGVVSWTLEAVPSFIEIRLFWYTQGRGAEDVQRVATSRLAVSGRAGQESFQFTMPMTPYSFNGRLISLNWAIEAIADPGGEVARQDIVMSPQDQDIVLSQMDEPRQIKPKGWYVRRT